MNRLLSDNFFIDVSFSWRLIDCNGIYLLSVMLSSPDHYLSKRFKTTLAVFQSYCQKKSQSVSQLREDLNCVNSSITKYRSIRELRKANQQRNEKQAKMERKNEATRTVGDVPLALKHSELIEIIKLKLHDSEHTPGRVKTEHTESRYEAKSYMPSKKGSEVINFNNKSIPFGKNFKKRRIELVVKNSKINQTPHSRRDVTSEEVIVTLRQRPCSAMAHAYPAPCSPVSSPSRPNINQAAHISAQSDQKQKTEQNSKVKYSLDLDRNKDIKGLSGWEITAFEEEDFLQEDENKEKKSLKRKRK